MDVFNKVRLRSGAEERQLAQASPGCPHWRLNYCWLHSFVSSASFNGPFVVITMPLPSTSWQPRAERNWVSRPSPPPIRLASFSRVGNREVLVLPRSALHPPASHLLMKRAGRVSVLSAHWNYLGGQGFLKMLMVGPFPGRSDAFGLGYESVKSPFGDSNMQARLKSTGLNPVLVSHPPKQGSVS